MSLAQIRQLDRSECESLFQSLGDTPETVIAGRQLRRGLCDAYVEVGAARHDAVVLRPFRPSDELVGVGTDVESLGRVLGSLSDWFCVNVNDGTARRLGPITAHRSLSSVLMPRRSISNSIPTIGGRLKNQRTPRAPAEPILVRITSGRILSRA
jgi:hypothetical protein